MTRGYVSVEAAMAHHAGQARTGDVRATAQSVYTKNMSRWKRTEAENEATLRTVRTALQGLGARRMPRRATDYGTEYQRLGDAVISYRSVFGGAHAGADLTHVYVASLGGRFCSFPLRADQLVAAAFRHAALPAIFDTTAEERTG